ncbi:MGH1-like glycoside hydrolase domain-containing protein [Arthrobacter monumenti]
MTVPNVADALTTAAIHVLDNNWAGSHTLPASGLYPHQWSWDSGFIAMGLRHVHQERAQLELESLLNGQWADGRVPQIVYDVSRDDDYSPGASFWRSTQHAAAPSVPTTGLIQPPNHAWAAWEVHQAHPTSPGTKEFLARVYPRLVAWHDYLASRRTLGSGPLAAVVHPWESGMDNSPLWDEALARVPSTPQHQVNRPDLAHADMTERPSEKEYGKYYWLAEQYRDQHLDDVHAELSFVMEDPTFNALWARSELALASIAEVIGADSSIHRNRAQDLTSALASLYDEELGLFTARDVITGTLVRKATISGIIPLILPDLAQAPAVLRTLMGPKFLEGRPFMVPSYDVLAEDFEPNQYWRGPAWFNMTWLVILGLRTYGGDAEADRLAQNLCDLAFQHDFPEYVHPGTGTPHGTRNFSWTASLALDLVQTGGPAARISAGSGVPK